jgi:uncharacterized protein with ATP-grasp and redox domains
MRWPAGWARRSTLPISAYMKTYLDCYPCFLRQALEAARLAGVDDVQQKAILSRVLELLGQVELASTPPEVGGRIHRLVRQETGNADPYQALKQESTRQALAFYPQMRALVAQSDDPLDTAVRLSIAGNIIDLGPNREYDLSAAVKQVLTQPFAIDDNGALREILSRTNRLLYLADNAGETAFDRVLIEVLGKSVLYAVKGGPVLNDAAREDALAAGLDQVAEIVDTGSDAPGTILEYCSQAFQRLYNAVDLVIAKGQANYETLSAAGPKVFFLLQVKCPVIARDLEVALGSIVLKKGD